MTNGDLVGTAKYMTAGEAAAFLGIGKSAMSRLLNKGVLPFITSKIDSRIKMVKRADVEALAQENLRKYPKTDPQAA